MKRPNKTRIRITGSPLSASELAIHCERLYHLRTARKIGDEEVVNNTVLGTLNDNSLNIQYEKVEAEHLVNLERNMLKIAEYGKIAKRLAEIAYEGNMSLDIVMGDMSLIRKLAESELKSLDLKQECCEA